MATLAIKPAHVPLYLQAVPEIVGRAAGGGGDWSRRIDVPGALYPIQVSGSSDGATFTAKIDGPGLYQDDFDIRGTLDSASWKASIDVPGVPSPTWRAHGEQDASGWRTEISPPGFGPSQRESGTDAAPAWPGSGPANFFTTLSSALSQAIAGAVQAG